MRSPRGVLLLGLLAFSLNACAMSALEFVKMTDASAQRKALEPIIYGWVSGGYKEVPDWAPLSNYVRALVLAKGYAYQSLEDVAKEAALAHGMNRAF